MNYTLDEIILQVNLLI